MIKKFLQVSLPIFIIVLMTILEFKLYGALAPHSDFWQTHPIAIWWWIGAVMVVMILNFIVNLRESFFKGWDKILYRYLQGNGSDKWANIFFLLYTLLHLSWIADSVFDCVKEPDAYSWWQPTTFLGGFILVLIMKPVYDRVDVDNIKSRTTLITGLSEIKYTKDLNSDDIFCNLDVLLKILQKNPGINQIRILLSDQMLKGYENICKDLSSNALHYNSFRSYKKAVEKFCLSNKCCELTGDDIEWFTQVLSDLINSCMHTSHRCFDVICSAPVDYNNFEICYNGMSNLINKKDVSNSDIIINITGGTSIVSAASSIQAVVGERCLMYINQKNGHPESYNPQIGALPELLKEIN